MRISWEKPIILFFTGGITYLVLTLVCAIIPAEQVPRVEHVAKGTTIYAIKSLRETVCFPLGWVLVEALLIGFSIYHVRRHPMAVDARPSRLTVWLVRLIMGVFVIIILLLNVRVVIVDPYRDFRKATVEPEAIELTSLYRTWTIKPSDVQDVAVVQRQDKLHGERRDSLHLLVATKDGRTYGSVEIEGLDPKQPELKAYRDVFDALAAAIKGTAKQKLAK